PDWDGQAGSQLITFLGGGSEAKDGTTVNYVQLDRTASDGRHHRCDPRVGMVGGSYGGGIQFAVASVDPRMDTIVPLITWNELSYSLDPNNTSQSVGVSTSTPGAVKLVWGLGFSATGGLDGLENAQGDPSR